MTVETEDDLIRNFAQKFGIQTEQSRVVCEKLGVIGPCRRCQDQACIWGYCLPCLRIIVKEWEVVQRIINPPFPAKESRCKAEDCHTPKMKDSEYCFSHNLDAWKTCRKCGKKARYDPCSSCRYKAKKEAAAHG